MKLNLNIDDALIEEGLQLSHEKIATQTLILNALTEYIQRHKRLAVLNEFGQYDFDLDYDYKTARQKR